jgi:antitoxin PrlF
MPTIHEVASVTSKGQITLPKAIRQLLDISVGGKIAFDLRGAEVVVSKVDQEGGNDDPAIGAFLSLLENDIKAGNVVTLPEDLVQAMMANLHHSLDMENALENELDDDIVGEVAL